MKNFTPHNTGDIRCKGMKSDEDLAMEWHRLKLFVVDTIMAIPQYPDELARMADIEKELGKDRLEFLVFKIKTDEKLKHLEDSFVNRYEGSFKAIIDKLPKKPWYKRLWLYLTDIDIETLLVCLALFIIGFVWTFLAVLHILK